MSVRFAPWTAAIVDLLGDGRWHPVEEAFAVGARAVPPGVALREGERIRQCQRVGGPGPRKRGNDDTAIAAGARDKARAGLRNLVRYGHIERDGDRIRSAR